MRIAILSDIHSNLHALTKAFSIIDRSRIDSVYCLGDIVGYGAHPNECVQLVRDRCEHVVIGNHDVAAVNPAYADYFTKPGKTAAEWTHAVLHEEHSGYLSSLPYTVVTGHLTLVHASPADPQAWEYVQSLERARRQFDAFTTRLCFIGHTHVPFLCAENLRTFVFKNDMRMLVNVGSVGQPRDGNPALCFGVLDTEAGTFQHIRAEYDAAGACKAIINSGLPSVLGKRLLVGQ